MQIPEIGHALTFHYGAPTGHFVGKNELRIGSEPGGYRLVLSTGNGEFPIRPYVLNGEEYLFTFRDEAEIVARELGDAATMAVKAGVSLN